jgi:VIT1/CCC1 family predicted Fe2+/Mn2+ transporter
MGNLSAEEWDKLWWDEFRRRRKEDPTGDMGAMHASVRRAIHRTFGRRPKEPVGPPWWTHIAAPALGVPMDKLTKFWTYMSGKKTAVGAVITVVASIAVGLPLILPLFIADAALIAQITGIALTIVGVLHKLYKFIYREKHPSQKPKAPKA